MARVETQHGVTASLGTTYTSLGQGPAATTWVVVLTVTNRLTSTVKLRAFVVDTSGASGEPTGSTLKAAIAYDTIHRPRRGLGEPCRRDDADDTEAQRLRRHRLGSEHRRVGVFPDMRIRQQRRRGWLPAVASMSGSATCQAQPVGTWYELISATTSAIYVNRMGGFWGAAGSTFELGIGLAGAEVSIGSLTYESLIEPFVHLPVPIRIPAGTRVAGRSTGNFQGLVIGYLNESVVGSQRPYILPRAAVITTPPRVRL